MTYLLLACILYLVMKQQQLRKQIRYMADQLESLNQDRTKKKIDISLCDVQIERLAFNINQNIKNQENLMIEKYRQEEKLKQFILYISHDLRTPLTSVMGYLQLMKKPNISREKEREYLEIVTRKTKVLNELIHDFFDLSLYESEEFTLELITIDLTKIMSNTILAHYQQFKEKKIKLETLLPEKTIRVLGDEVAWIRIVENLLSNVIKYAENEVQINLVHDDEFAYFSIQNKTNDLTESSVLQLFSPFFKGDISRNAQGTGLGLSIVKLLVEKQQGQISAELMEGKQLIIRIKMPLANQV